MGLFGPTSYDIKKGIEDAISPKTSHLTTYYIRAIISKKDINGLSEKWAKDFPMSEIAFKTALLRKATYENIVDWFNSQHPFGTNSHNAKIEKILVGSKTSTSTYFPLTYKTEHNDGSMLTVCSVDPVTFKEDWMGFKPDGFEESRAREIREQLRVIFKDKDDFRLIN